MKDCFIVHAKRTPIGKFGGGLAPVRPDDMLALLVKDFVKSTKFDLQLIDDFIAGCANQAGEDNRNVARMSGLMGGLPIEVPASTTNRLCGSSLDALITAVAKIKSNLGDCFLIGGVESMSRAPYVVSKTASPYGRDQKFWDTTMGWRFPNPELEKLYPLYSMGQTAEEVAKLHKISREEQDEFAFQSHQKAVAAQSAGAFNKEILPVEVKLRKNSYTVERDEGPRADTDLDKLKKLRAVFAQDGTVTAGNASSINDGASLVMVVSEQFVKDHGLTPFARLTGTGIRGCHPNVMGLGPVHATNLLCKKNGMKAQDFDVIELNEAFAAQSLGCIKELELDPAKINLNGGAIALGHPLGCSGARILTTLVYQMAKNPSLKQGLATMCIGVGQGIAVSIENCK